MLFGKSKQVCELRNKVESQQDDLNYKDRVIEDRNATINCLKDKIAFLESEDSLYLETAKNDIAKEYESLYASQAKSVEKYKQEASDAREEAAKAKAQLAGTDKVIAEKDATIAHMKEMNKFFATRIPEFDKLNFNTVGTKNEINVAAGAKPNNEQKK